jgi:hypothetical protein
MRGTRIRGALGALLALGVVGLLAREARAGEAGDRLARVESELARQARRTEALREETGRLRREIRSATAGAAPPRDASAPLPRLERRRTPASGPLLGHAASGGLRWGGYLTTSFTARSHENSHFGLGRLVFAADAGITRAIDFHAEVEFENGGVTDELDGEVSIEQAEVVLHVCDLLNPKAGALLIPFSRYNRYHDDPLNDFTDRPFTARYLVPTGFGQPGVGVEGAGTLRGGHVFSYDVAVTSGFRDDFLADEGTRDARQFWSGDENAGKQVWGRAAVVWHTCALDTLETGLSGTWGRYDLGNRNDLFGWGADLLLRRGPWEVQAEVLGYDFHRDAADPPDAIRGQWGWYVSAAYHFFPCGLGRCASRCSPVRVLTDTSLFTLAGRYQHVDLDDRVHGATFQDDLDAWSVALNLRITERTVIRIDHTWFVPARGATQTQLALSLSTFL